MHPKTVIGQFNQTAVPVLVGGSRPQ